MDQQQWFERLLKVECPDSSYRADPALVFAQAKGSTVWDEAGRAYLDLCAGFGVHALGHNPDEYKQVWQTLLTERPPVLHAMGDVYPSTDKIVLLEKLVGLMPPHLEQAGLALSGGQAVEFALKTALLARRRPGVIAFKQSYHGLDFGSLAVTFRDDFRGPFASWLTPAVRFIDYASESSTLMSQFEAAVAELNECGGLACVIMEPIQGRGGVIDPGGTWRKQVADLTHSHDALLILDEVFVGLGRTGRMTYADEVKADLTCLGKPLGGGLPLSACIGTRAAMGAWPENRGEAIHTGTFFGHPLACRLGHIFLSVLEANNLCKRTLTVGAAWREELRSVLEPFGAIQVRGEGLMIGIDFGTPLTGVLVSDVLREKGIIALPSSPTGQVLSLTPPLVIDSDQIAMTTSILLEVVKTL
jgi:4-aminobutyrate aminotransferase/(S)-3-amino-2-methylpropionate transaminase